MKSVIIITAYFISTCFVYSNSNQFEFPNNKMGEFAKEWFEYINAENADYLIKYDPEQEWIDHITLIKNVSEKVGGLIPKLISYQTSNFISIYSEQKKGGWVIVDLGLNSKDQIDASGIKKTFIPEDYSLRDNLTTKEIKSIIISICDQIKNNYVVKKSRSSFSNRLRELLNNGKYDTITQGDFLAKILTDDLKAISNDKHLQVIPPSRLSEVKNRFGTESSTESQTRNDQYTEDISNLKARVLDNNIGYITLDRFVHRQTTMDNTEKAFTNLLGTRAIIVDLRNSGGGDGQAAANLLSYFVKETEIKKTYPDFDQISSSTQVPLKSRFLKTPLYVLTSSRTISAGESFVYFLKKNKRATIIGEQTAGAGYRVNVFEVTNNFHFVNSIYSSFDIESGNGWQGAGITPDVVTSRSKSLDTAIARILKKS